MPTQFKNKRLWMLIAAACAAYLPVREYFPVYGSIVFGATVALMAVAVGFLGNDG